MTTTQKYGTTYIIENSREHDDRIREQYGWTHLVGLRRPKGTKVYFAHAVMDEQGQVVVLSDTF